ncbi:LysR family transcriptional regulator [Pseudohoeflea coraliihabitans]|uniref:LysR family transcriptional regulator n=1 Tax=Pseudohoeflea coraliihabitans TaxID=2860393 RepID=A0ABS6WMP2_9HYPH|nr:LysR family transcriptional regulator [Pseudohoeflea sp. DP4N28-3]MBW3097234.1 LysR family transcriptional regulator [Pseudohoeflea sp. DP4N28-3]
MRINFEFAELEAFLVLLETRSFVAAARYLGVSQSALTRRIHKLETALGAMLFERTTRSVRPTLAAKRLQPRAQAMVENARETMHELRDDTARFAHQNRAIVTIAAVPSAIPRIVMPALRLFRTGPSEARVRILDFLAHDVTNAVAEGKADFGVSSLPVSDRSVVFEPLVDDRVVLAVLREHPLASQQSVKWETLSAHPLILPSQGSGNRALIDQAMARAQRSLFWNYEVPRTSTALELVRSGLGIAPLPRSAIPISGEGGIVTCELTHPAISRTIGLIDKTDAACSPSARRLRDMIISAGRDAA